jgi:hypothetical protein
MGKEILRGAHKELFEAFTGEPSKTEFGALLTTASALSLEKILPGLASTGYFLKSPLAGSLAENYAETRPPSMAYRSECVDRIHIIPITCEFSVITYAYDHRGQRAGDIYRREPSTAHHGAMSVTLLVHIIPRLVGSTVDGIVESVSCARHVNLE